MDAQVFDALTRRTAAATSRRGVLAAFGGGTLALLAGGRVLGSAANGAVQAEACRLPGRKCTKSGQCCTRKCTGKKKRKRCRGCSVQSCRPEMNLCGDYWCECPGDGACTSKLDGDSFCAWGLGCVPCADDDHCNTVFGIESGGACIHGSAGACDCVFPGFNPEGTACAVQPGLSCTVNGDECESATECCSGGPCGEWEGVGRFCRSDTCKPLGEPCDPALWDTDCCEGICDLETNTCTQVSLEVSSASGRQQTRRHAPKLRQTRAVG
jgi:hypothetical protein